MPLIYHNRKEFFHNTGAILFLLVAFFVLMPRLYETGGESWKAWASARILRESGEWQVFSKGPFYITYLQLYSFFEYPLSIRLEYFFTNLFCVSSLYFMLKNFIPGKYALLLTCAWTPLIGLTEGGAVPAGMGFLALHFNKQYGHSISSKGYIPPFLGLSAFCHSAYLPFLIGHVIGTMFEKYRSNKPFFSVSIFFNRSYFTNFLIHVGLLILLSLTFLFPIQRADLYNSPMGDQTYYPFSGASGLTTAFFELGHFQWVVRHIPDHLMMHEDWYFTHQKSFGGAKSILEAVQFAPKTVLENLAATLHNVNRLPIYFLTGHTDKLTLLSINFVLLVIFLLSFVGMIFYFLKRDMIAFSFSILLGAFSMVGVMLLTSFNLRYIIIILPVGLLVVANIDKGMIFVREKISLMTEKNGLILGGILIFTGVLTMEPFLPEVIIQKLTFRYRLEIRILNVIFIAVGIFLIFSKEKIKKIVFHDFWTKNACRVRNMVIVASSVACLTLTPYAHGKIQQIKSVLYGKPLMLKPQRDFSMIAFNEKLQNSLSENPHVLALEFHWILAFTDVAIERVHQVISLPPFEDKSGKTEKFLNKMDVIWVSEGWEKPDRQPTSSQKYLRFILHVEPFLKKVMQQGWTVEDVPYFGKIYRRPT